MQVIIGIGAGDSGVLGGDVKDIVRAHGSVVAYVNGTSFDKTWGEEEDVTWLAAEFDSFNDYLVARESILRRAGDEGEDAVAFTIGVTEIAETL